MKITPEELPDQGFILTDKLEHNNLVPFVQKYLKKKTKILVLYYLSNFLVVAFAGYHFVKGKGLPEYDLGERFADFALGLALAFLLVPLHEYIHVLAYRSQGAENTSYDANLKKFYFMALAHRFVANKKEFTVVALAPFVSITTLLAALIFIAPSSWTLTITGVLVTHTAMCSGDFGLLNYFEYFKKVNVVTYDDTETKVSYFLHKLPGGDAR